MTDKQKQFLIASMLHISPSGQSHECKIIAKPINEEEYFDLITELYNIEIA